MYSCFLYQSVYSQQFTAPTSHFAFAFCEMTVEVKRNTPAPARISGERPMQSYAKRQKKCRKNIEKTEIT